MITIAPAILARDTDAFIQRLKALDGHVSVAQIDVLDNTLIAGETIADPSIIESLHTSLSFEVHLMVDVAQYPLEQWNHSWVESIVVHCESPEYESALKKIRSWGKKAFIAINPDTPDAQLESVINLCDGVMFMTVAPGAMGNAFRHDVLERIAQFHMKYPKMIIEVDGGVNASTIKQLVNAGVSRFAVGSFIDSEHVDDRIAELQHAVA